MCTTGFSTGATALTQAAKPIPGDNPTFEAKLPTGRSAGYSLAETNGQMNERSKTPLKIWLLLIVVFALGGVTGGGSAVSTWVGLGVCWSLVNHKTTGVV